MMATHHVCDVCGCEMPKDVERQYYMRIGAKKSYRDFVEHPVMLTMDIECCPKCAEKIYAHIERMCNTRSGDAS